MGLDVVANVFACFQANVLSLSNLIGTLPGPSLRRRRERNGDNAASATTAEHGGRSVVVGAEFLKENAVDIEELGFDEEHALSVYMGRLEARKSRSVEMVDDALDAHRKRVVRSISSPDSEENEVLDKDSESSLSDDRIEYNCNASEEEKISVINAILADGSVSTATNETAETTGKLKHLIDEYLENEDEDCNDSYDDRDFFQFASIANGSCFENDPRDVDGELDHRIVKTIASQFMIPCHFSHVPVPNFDLLVATTLPDPRLLQSLDPRNVLCSSLEVPASVGSIGYVSFSLKDKTIWLDVTSGRFKTPSSTHPEKDAELHQRVVSIINRNKKRGESHEPYSRRVASRYIVLPAAGPAASTSPTAATGSTSTAGCAAGSAASTSPTAATGSTSTAGCAAGHATGSTSAASTASAAGTEASHAVAHIVDNGVKRFKSAEAAALYVLKTPLEASHFNYRPGEMTYNDEAFISASAVHHAEISIVIGTERKTYSSNKLPNGDPVPPREMFPVGIVMGERLIQEKPEGNVGWDDGKLVCGYSTQAAARDAALFMAMRDLRCIERAKIIEENLPTGRDWFVPVGGCSGCIRFVFYRYKKRLHVIDGRRLYWESLKRKRQDKIGGKDPRDVFPLAVSLGKLQIGELFDTRNCFCTISLIFSCTPSLLCCFRHRRT